MLFDRAQLTAALPQYEVGAELGRGGFGLVIEGRHRRLGRPVAIKILTISGPDVERRFLAEAQVMAVFDHPHVVRVHDYAESDGLCLIVMEHLPGGTLTSRIAEGLRPETAIAIGLAIADALHAAHERGIVHRDIKPDNVLFAADGAVKVTDFGIAKLFEGSTITTGTLVGTPAYAAPEQILGQRIGPQTDVYAVGGLIYHMLAGRTPFSLELPFSAMLHHHLNMRPELPAGMPPRIAEVVGQALEKEPADRPASAKAFALALADAAAAEFGTGWSARAETPLRVDDDIRAAVTLTGGAGQARAAAIRPRSPARRQRSGDTPVQLQTPPPGHLAIPGYDAPDVAPPATPAWGYTPTSFGHGHQPPMAPSPMTPSPMTPPPYSSAAAPPATPTSFVEDPSGGLPPLTPPQPSVGTSYGHVLTPNPGPSGPSPITPAPGPAEVHRGRSGRHAADPDAEQAGAWRPESPGPARHASGDHPAPEGRAARRRRRPEPVGGPEEDEGISRRMVILLAAVVAVVAVISIAIGAAIGYTTR
ncbi:serine/threonine-protein kinase [Cryptosporangium phraense]|uniref:non-specific serine/threonine protein kinase n=1 Tax=Cryptosporangium phraense TaxID=2593070 RepID=A0A545AG82_9ACTN|nr:serine/threonine-protein kinase [Cryptosporangium phraense]TQS40342.1 protein kinase [Cryptosporangium phraense]